MAKTHATFLAVIPKVPQYSGSKDTLICNGLCGGYISFHDATSTSTSCFSKYRISKGRSSLLSSMDLSF